MYQPRISVSISHAHEVARSAGHWKRKLRTRKGASGEVSDAALKTACLARPQISRLQWLQAPVSWQSFNGAANAARGHFTPGRQNAAVVTQATRLPV